MELTTDRETAFKCLQGYVSFISLKEGQKAPQHRFSKRQNRFSYPPFCSNVGAVPIKRTVVVDIDTKKTPLTPEEQMLLLEDEYGLPLSKTFRVRTPSGGLHCYISWPDDVELPKNRKLLKLGKSFDGDLRSAGINGYCVFPGSIVEGGVYQVNNPAAVKEVSKDSASLIIHKLQTAIEREKIEELLEGKPNPNTVYREVDYKKLGALEKLLEKYRLETFVTKRAAIYRALSCCESDQTILEYWQALGIDRDTSKNCKNISSKTLSREFVRLTHSITHSRVCGGLSKANPESTPKDISELVINSVKRKRGYYKPTVLDYPKFIKILNSGRQKPGKAYPLAVAIFEDFLQVWSNLGKSSIMLSDDYLASFYSLPKSEVKAAKRMLIARGVIYVSRKQGPGRTTVFKVSPNLRNDYLSRVLYAMRSESLGNGVIIDSRKRCFVSALDSKLEVQVNFWKMPIENIPESPERKNVRALALELID